MMENLQLTRDGREELDQRRCNVPNLPKASWVSWVESQPYMTQAQLMPHSIATRLGDMGPSRLQDHGLWEGPGTSIVPADSGVARPTAHVIKEDTVRPNLLFSGYGVRACGFSTGWRQAVGRDTKATNFRWWLSGTSSYIRANRIW